jgi:cellobiose phosphorylase
MKRKLWQFTDDRGSFEFPSADKIKSLYFPLCNQALMSSITPDGHGDIKAGQNSFLLTPVSRTDLINSKSSRNFWVYLNEKTIWPVTKGCALKLNAGLLWHKVTTENKRIGLKAEILSFIPSSGEPVEIMQVTLTNISSKKIRFVPTAAIPIYARGADNLRDHRHVTSLLQRISLNKFGVVVKPTLSFDESGHKPNKANYFVLGWDGKSKAPEYIYPTQEMFCGETGDLEAPESILNNHIPTAANIQGKEAMGALRFAEISLKPGESRSYIILMGITENKAEIDSIINKFNSLAKVKTAFKDTKDFWVDLSQQVKLSTGDSNFDNWFRWVSIQPHLRKIFGCSFLPDFDYGKGGRGWRDLWQDCLGLILSGSKEARNMLINNFSGVRIDGSNATIIGKKPGEFISDRNNISRVWMDHGIWPLITLDLYINETGVFNILSEQVPYFRDHLVKRAREVDANWDKSCGQKLKTSLGRIYQGTILEHLLVQNLVQFFNVGSHNYIRLEGADWNDGLDMARENGESVAFSAMYAHNLMLLVELLEKVGKEKVEIAEELGILLAKTNYDSVKIKLSVLDKYFSRTQSSVSGRKISLNTRKLSVNLREKAEWMSGHIRRKEWLKEGFFNGYYDNQKKRVEGKKNSILRMMLASQVFPIMSGVVDKKQISGIQESIDKYLKDKKSGGIRLNTDFKQEQPNLGRAFSFVYGDKENGAFFNHMVVMYAYALYKRRYVNDGWEVLSSISNMALDTEKSKIYPCLPEYFNAGGRGMYSYLTGSASWFVLTILTEVFGIKGQDGNLLIEPKLSSEQFKHNSTISINRSFAGRKLQINFSNPKRLEYGEYKIAKAANCLIIPRQTILSLPVKQINIIDVNLD